MVRLELSHTEITSMMGDISIEQISQLLASMGMELEQIDGDELKIDITPDRPDMVSAQGLVRALKAYRGDTIPTYKVHPSSYKVQVDQSVSRVRPKTVCAVVTGLTLDDDKLKQIIWVQEKLHDTFGRQRRKAAIGIYPMDAIVWPISYQADLLDNIQFVALGSDKSMNGKQILNEHPTGKAYGHLIKGKKAAYFKDASGAILSMPPIINAESTGKVTLHTKDVFIECSGHDQQALHQTLVMICCMLADMGGTIHTVNVSYPNTTLVTPDMTGERRSLRISLINRLLGLDLDTQTCATLLTRMGYQVEQVTESDIVFTVAPYRVDIWHDVDVIDDILRGYGIENVDPIFPDVPGVGKQSDTSISASDVADVLVGLGFQEAVTLSLTNQQDQFNKMNIAILDHMSLGHAAEQSLSMIRVWLVPELIKCFMHNRNREFPQKLFEISDVVIPDTQCDVRCRNETRVVAGISGSQADFTAIRQVVDYLGRVLGVAVEYQPVEHGSFIPGRCASVHIDGKNIGMVGEIHPAVLEQWGLQMPLVCCELDLGGLSNVRP